MTSVRPISDLSELYYDFGEYRLEILEERIRVRLKQLRDRRRAGKKIDTAAIKKFLAEQEAFLKHTNQEIVEEDKVMVGHIEEVDYPDEKVGHANDNKPTAKRASKRARVE